MKRPLAAAIALLWAVAGPHPIKTAAAVEPAAAERTVKCAECGMSAQVDNRFTARIVEGGTTRYFCDIGDLVSFLKRTAPKKYQATVHDFTSGEWLDASTAWFVIDKKVFSSPMGWGIAAFRDRAAASGVPMGFEALRKALQ